MSNSEGGETRRPRDVVVVGASAGGVQALVELAQGLPAELPAAVFIVLHMPDGATSSLQRILARVSALGIAEPEDGAEVVPGTITVARPDHHLFLEHGRVRLVRGPKVNGYRPAVDVLFQSAARSYDGRVIGVVLTGTQSDGTLGLHAIKRRGGAAVVQADPEYEGMPRSALRNVDVDAVVPLREIADTLARMVRPGKETAVGDEIQAEESPLATGFDVEQLAAAEGPPTIFRCPECGGSLWQIEDGELQAFVCHVGHSFSAESLLSQQRDDVERALWSAVRLLEEQAALNDRLAERVEKRGLTKSKKLFESRARRADEDAETIRNILQTPNEAAEAADEGEAA